ncbi:hypothetical protein VNO77_00745 [Canavalia gladiata]|uniref:Uncharacterized protein n=1 Tax=Canavalia gladiata TaxID=3824 RepID=A0AAN9R4N6_CANGL
MLTVVSLATVKLLTQKSQLLIKAHTFERMRSNFLNYSTILQKKTPTLEQRRSKLITKETKNEHINA